MDAKKATQEKPRYYSFYIVGLIFVAIFCCLSYWQVQRYDWKINLIESFNKLLFAPPTPLLHDLPVEPDQDFFFKRYMVSGDFQEDSDLFVPTVAPKNWKGPRTVGYSVFALLNPENRAPIAVQLGWIPEEERIAFELPKEKITLMVIPMKPNKDPFWQTSAKFSNENTLSSINISMMDQHWEKPTVPYYFKVLKQPKEAPEWPFVPIFEKDFTNNHLGYAITWGALAFIVLLLMIWHFREHRKLK